MPWKNIRLGDVLTQRRHRILIEPESNYKQITVRLWGKGLLLRGVSAGSEIAAESQVAVEDGDFLISKIDARHGAFGLVPDDLRGAVVSNDFPCFAINKNKIHPRFIEWFSKTERFIALCKRASAGSTNRVRLSEDKFLDLEIPLPSLDEQQRIVSKLDDVQKRLNDRMALLKSIDQDANGILFNTFQTVIDGAKRQPLGEFAPLVRREVAIDPDKEYTEIGVKSFFNGIFHRRTMLGSEFSWQSLFYVSENDLVFSNLMAWEKAIALAGAVDHGCVGNHRMLTCEVDRSLAVPSFLLFYFRTPEGFSKIVGHSPGTIARNKTLSTRMLPSIEVPLPSIAIQRRFAALSTQVTEMREVRAQADMDGAALLPAMLHAIFERDEIKKEVVPVLLHNSFALQHPVERNEVNTPFKEAVLVGAIVEAFSGDGNQPMGNFRLQKAVYFARRHMGECALDTEYLRKAAGPYNPSMRYAGGIKIATEKKWVVRARGAFGEGSTLGSSAPEMDAWITKYQFAPVAAWVRDKFKFKSNDMWETLATVDYAMLALAHAGKAPTVAAILAYIENDPEWHTKIAKLHLTAASIQRAIVELDDLFSITPAGMA